MGVFERSLNDSGPSWTVWAASWGFLDPFWAHLGARGARHANRGMDVGTDGSMGSGGIARSPLQYSTLTPTQCTLTYTPPSSRGGGGSDGGGGNFSVKTKISKQIVV